LVSEPPPLTSNNELRSRLLSRVEKVAHERLEEKASRAAVREGKRNGYGKGRKGEVSPAADTSLVISATWG